MSVMSLVVYWNSYAVAISVCVCVRWCSACARVCVDDIIYAHTILRRRLRTPINNTSYCVRWCFCVCLCM